MSRWTIAVGVLLVSGLGRAQTDQSSGNLKGLSLEQLGNIEVTGVSKGPVKVARTPAAIYVITQEDIRRSGVTSLPEALRLAPGVDVAKIDGVKWAIGIRGFENRLSRAVLVLIDGRSVYSPLFHGVYWEVQDTLLEDVDRIEVIRGPGGIIWGANAVNGVINIVTKSSTETQGTLVSAGGGNVQQGFLDFRYGADAGHNLTYRIYGKGATVGPEFHPDGRQFDDWRRVQAGFRADWEANARDTVTLQGDIYDGMAGESVRITSLSPPSANIVDQNADLSGGNILARWKRIISGDSDFQLQFYYDRVNRRQANQAEFRDTFDIDFVHHLALRWGQDFIWGAGARLSLGRVPEVVPTYMFTPQERTDQLYTAFVQDQIPIVGDKLSLTIGSKLLHSSFTGFDAEPQARLLWAPAQNHSFWGAVTRAIRTPSDIEDTLTTTNLVSINPVTYSRTAGDKQFTSETMVGYEAGYRALLHPSLSIDIATFYNQYDHLLSLEPGTPYTEISPAPIAVIQPFFNGNGVKGTTSGFEIVPNWKPTSWWRLEGSFAYLKMNLHDKPGSRDTTTVTSLEGSSPHHQLVVQSYLDLPGRIEFSQAFRYVSALPAQFTGSYATADARLSWRPLDHLELALVGQNLLQPRHVEFGGDPGILVGIRRSAFVSLTWRK